MLNTPILFLIFNRPDTTAQVFAKIREIQPKQLFIAADGPRADRAGEAEKCALAKQIVLDNIDWDCEVKTLFRTENLGCGVAPAQAITWFFEQVEQGIILEDDCLPDLSFFTFCEELLNYYKDDDAVMHISGNNFQLGKKIGDGSYYFSQQPYCWGWATWRRVWVKFSYDLADLDIFINENPDINSFWKNTFINLREEKPQDIWDFQYTYTIFKYHGMSIIPNINLITNIGFNENATHTKGALLYYYNQDFGYIRQIIHPTNKRINEMADKFDLETYYIQKISIQTKIRYNVKRIKDNIKRILMRL